MRTVSKPPPIENTDDGGPMSKGDGTDEATIRPIPDRGVPDCIMSISTPITVVTANTSRRRAEFILPKKPTREFPDIPPTIDREEYPQQQPQERETLKRVGTWNPVSKATQFYRYQPLAPGQDFRVLLVQKGRARDPLTCRLVPSALPSSRGHPESARMISYEALSYTWGPDSSALMVEILDEETSTVAGDEGSVVYIRPNLYAALLQLRSPEDDVALWVDALCINFDDPSEKSQQVSRLHEIFSQASNVCIWLGHGEDPDQTRQTFDFIREMLNLRHFDQLYSQQQAAQWNAFAQLMRNRWFTRLWVVQEIALAKEATVHYGNEVVQWTDFRDAIALFVARYKQINSLLKSNNYILDPARDIRALGANTLVTATSNLFRRGENGRISDRLLSLETLVSTLVTFECTDPRDKIYALLAIAKDTPYSTPQVVAKPKAPWILSSTKDVHIPPDSRIALNYEKGFVDVFVDFINFCIEQSKSLDIICRHWSPVPPDTGCMPSWISSIRNSTFGNPDMAMRGRSNGDSLVGVPTGMQQTNYYASGDLVPVAHFGKYEHSNRLNGTLLVKGMVLDVIETLSPRAAEGVIPEEALRMGGWSHDDPPERVPDNLWRTLVADRGPDGAKAPSWYYRACLVSLTHVTQYGDLSTVMLIDAANTPSVMVAFLTRVQEVVWNRKFLLSRGDNNDQKTYFGLAPTNAKRGDLICILFGLSVPIILREVREGPGYTVIGEAYIYGMMDGEALSEEHPEYPYHEYQTFELH